MRIQRGNYSFQRPPYCTVATGRSRTTLVYSQGLSFVFPRAASGPLVRAPCCQRVRRAGSYSRPSVPMWWWLLYLSGAYGAHYTLFSTECTAFFDWQSVGLFYSHSQVSQPEFAPARHLLAQQRGQARDASPRARAPTPLSVSLAGAAARLHHAPDGVRQARGLPWPQHRPHLCAPQLWQPGGQRRSGPLRPLQQARLAQPLVRTATS